MKLNQISHCKVVFLILAFTFTFQACKKSQSDFGAVIAKATGNKIFKEISPEEFAGKMKVALGRNKSVRNPSFTNNFYAAHDYLPVLVEKFLPDSSLKQAAGKVAMSEVHGLSPQIFRIKKLQTALNKIYDKSELKTGEAAIDALIDLELAASATLTDYSNALRFGVISPCRIYAQYYTNTKRPDSLSFTQVYETSNLVKYLDSIQPQSGVYKDLQAALAQNVAAPGLSLEETHRILTVNLERFRWQNQPAQQKYVWVNIPAFMLSVYEDGKPALNMKVCVGEGRNNGNIVLLTEYDENDLKKDRPFNRETPQLSSEIHSVQVNPVWNIPESIATNEITKYAARDRYYLSNNNIDVFYQGKKVEDPETIDFSAAGAGKTYTFKQRPGEDNSLGKIKFLFNNQSSVYLHDTPAKAAFSNSMRAISHGCVRVEQPLKLAEALFGSGAKLDKIKAGMASNAPKAEDIALDKKVPVYLSYYTCWKDSATGKLRFAKDIYGLDAVLYTHLQKMG